MVVRQLTKEERAQAKSDAYYQKLKEVRSEQIEQIETDPGNIISIMEDTTKKLSEIKKKDIRCYLPTDKRCHLITITSKGNVKYEPEFFKERFKKWLKFNNGERFEFYKGCIEFGHPKTVVDEKGWNIVTYNPHLHATITHKLHSFPPYKIKKSLYRYFKGCDVDINVGKAEASDCEWDYATEGGARVGAKFKQSQYDYIIKSEWDHYRQKHLKDKYFQKNYNSKLLEYCKEKILF